MEVFIQLSMQTAKEKKANSTHGNMRRSENYQEMMRRSSANFLTSLKKETCLLSLRKLQRARQDRQVWKKKIFFTLGSHRSYLPGKKIFQLKIGRASCRESV